MLFHHVVTLSLIIGSFMINYPRTAVIVFLCHAWADVGVYFVKVVVEFKSFPVAITAWLFCLLAYVWNRFIVFSKDVIYVVAITAIERPEVGTKPFLILLGGLMIFHIYTFYMVCLSGYKACTGGFEACDYQHEFYDKKSKETIIQNGKAEKYDKKKN